MLGANKKIAAFTLSEMLVVLSLTIIVIGLGFSSLNILQKQMWDIQGNYGEKTTYNILRQALWADFNSHEHIVFLTNEHAMNLSNEKTSRTYRFHKDYIIRNQDTFHIDLKINKLYFQGEEVSGGIIDAIELITSEKVTKKLFVYKTNTATNFMSSHGL